MKKIIRNSFALLAVSAMVMTTSCGSDDKPSNEEKSSFVVNPSNFQGNITSGTVTLDASVEYRLTGSLIIEAGAKLVIPAGTKIIGTGGTSSYIAVAQGGQIEINGTATNPVVMKGDQDVAGDWGGLVICGRAPINKGASATAEVSELTYGGTDANDNSGKIRYLRIENAGAAYNSEKEFNGLSLFGVGNGTTIEYVQIHNGADDGIEFFGGTVNTKYIVSSHNEDDAFDWTEGWNGTNEYWYGVQSTEYGDRGVEADNNSQNHLATPISNPTISKITLVGQNHDSSAIKLRVGTKGSFDNVVLKNWKTGIDIQHDETIDGIASQALKLSNVRFENVITNSKGKNTAGDSVDVSNSYTENANATGAGNGAGVPTWAQGWTVGL